MSSAEAALVIADVWQGRGLGRRLLATLIEHAQSVGVQQVVGVVLVTNEAMVGLARSMGFSVNAEPGDATVLRIRRDLAAVNAQPH
jgi:acetyltransferase